MLRSALSLLAALLLLSLPASTQQVPTLKVEPHLIDTTVSVHDTSGGLVNDLTKEDLSIVEDGVPQTIRFVSRVQQLPLSIGLVIDTSGSQEKFIPCVCFALAFRVLPLSSQQAATLNAPEILEHTKMATVIVPTGEGAGRLYSIATGVLISKDGVILAALHAIKGTAEVQVRMANGEVFRPS